MPPGDYTFQVNSYDHVLFRERPHFFTNFTVPALDAPALRASVVTNDLKLAVAGIANVTYIVQASSTLTNWTSVATNDGAPFTWKEAIVPQRAQRFYRLEIVGQ